MSKEAFVTLATNDTYGVGALVLGRSLRRVATSKQTVVLVTRDVSEKMKQELGLVFNLVVTVDPLDSGDAAHLALMSRPELGITFTKLHAWRLVQFSKCVFLDADTLVVQNCDELFERDELSAAPDPGWPDCFNSGVFVFVPSEETFKALLDFAVAHGSFDGGDQGLLNMFFSDWATGDIRKHLPFIYNVVSSATYSYLPALKYFGSQVKIAHFLGSNKPWMRQGQLGTPSPYQRAWWSIFREDVASRLSQDMIAARPLTGSSTAPSLLPRYRFKDPWDFIRYDNECSRLTVPKHQNPNCHSQISSTREEHSSNQIVLQSPTLVFNSFQSNVETVFQKSCLITQSLIPSQIENQRYQYYNNDKENKKTVTESYKYNPLRNSENKTDLPAKKTNCNSSCTTKENVGEPLNNSYNPKNHYGCIASTAKWNHEVQVYPENKSTPSNLNQSLTKFEVLETNAMARPTRNITSSLTKNTDVNMKLSERDFSTKIDHKIIRSDRSSDSRVLKNLPLSPESANIGKESGIDSSKAINRDSNSSYSMMNNNPDLLNLNQSFYKSEAVETNVVDSCAHYIPTPQTKTNELKQLLNKRDSTTKIDNKIIKSDHSSKIKESKNVPFYSKSANKEKKSELNRSIILTNPSLETHVSEEILPDTSDSKIFPSERKMPDLSEQKNCLKTYNEQQINNVENNLGNCTVSRVGADTMDMKASHHYQTDYTSDKNQNLNMTTYNTTQQKYLNPTKDENQIHKSAGVAGVLAREEPDDWRREAWEAGDVDYLGRDSFDNIWKRICECVGITAQTLSAPAAPAATSAGIANQPSAPTAAAEKPMQPASEKVVGAAPAEKPTASSEKPKEPVASAEKLAEPAVFAEKPTESVASAEKPGEPAISPEKPADPVMSVEKPPEPVILEKKSEEPVASIETPAETVTPGEKPSEPIVSGEKPVESAISAEKTAVSMVSAEKPPEPAVQKSAEPVVSAEKPAEPVVSNEKPAEPVVSTEKPAEPTVPGEKPAEIGVPSEKAAETALSVEKPTEPALPAEKPGELGLSAEKPVEPAVSAEKPAEPVVSAGKQAELTVSADKPSDPSSAAAPLPDKLPETAPVAVESPGIVDKEKKAESSAKVEKQESPKAVEIPTEKTSVEEKCIKQVEKPLETPETAKPVETQTKSTAIEKPKESADNVLKETETMPTEKKAEPALTSGKTVEVASTGENLAKKPVTPSTENVKPTGTVEVCPMKPSEPSGEARIQPPLVGGDAPVCKKEPGTPTITPPSGPASPQPADVPPEVCKLQATPSQPATPPASSHQTTDAPVPPKRKQGKNGKSGKGKK